MLVRYVPLVLTCLFATQTAQVANVLVSPFTCDPSQRTECEDGVSETVQPKPTLLVRAEGSDLKLVSDGNGSAIAVGNEQPQRQSSAAHPHHHTLRNILIITVAVGVMVIVLAAAAKK